MDEQEKFETLQKIIKFVTNKHLLIKGHAVYDQVYNEVIQILNNEKKLTDI